MESDFSQVGPLSSATVDAQDGGEPVDTHTFIRKGSFKSRKLGESMSGLVIAREGKCRTHCATP